MNKSQSSSPKIRIAHLLTALWPGGLEQFVLNLSRELPPDRYDIFVYAWMSNNPMINEFQAQGIQVRVLNAPNRIHGIHDVFRMLTSWIQLIFHLHNDRIKIIQTHDFLPSLIGRTASWFANTPYRISTLHNLYEWWPKWAFIVNRILSPITDRIVCVSSSVREYFISHECGPRDRYITILNAVSNERFHPNSEIAARIRSELGITPNEILIGCVGSITSRKAQYLLVQASSILIQKEIPIQVRIWGANIMNPQHAELQVRDEIARLGLEHIVKILPPRNDIEDMYRAMDIHCMTSTAEGLSLASVEAIMCGAYPVYSDIGPFQEVINPLCDGSLFHCGDSKHLALQLELAIEKLPNSRENISTRYKIAHQVFGMKRWKQQWHELYTQLSNK